MACATAQQGGDYLCEPKSSSYPLDETALARAVAVGASFVGMNKLVVMWSAHTTDCTCLNLYYHTPYGRLLSAAMRRGHVDTVQLIFRHCIGDQSFTMYQIQAARNGSLSTGPLCPSFETLLITRTYTLSLLVTVRSGKQVQKKMFRGGEIVMLPPMLDSSVKKRTLEMTGASSVTGLVELGGDGIYEIAGVCQVMHRSLAVELLRALKQAR